MNKIVLIFLLFFSIQSLSAQNIESDISRTHIKIGEPAILTFSIPMKEGLNIAWPAVKDTLSFHVEVLSQDFDTILKDQNKIIQYKIEITSFDPGKFFIKTLPFQINGETKYSKSFQLTVDEVAIDTAKNKIFPNKPNFGETYTTKDYWQKYWVYFVVVILLILIILVVLYLFFNGKPALKNKSKFKSPYDEALYELKNIDKKKYIEKEKYKEFYTDLSFVFKNYIGRVYHFSATELLSDEFIEEVEKKHTLSDTEMNQLKQFVTDSDLVKFSKSKLPQDKHAFYRKLIEELILHARPIEIPAEQLDDNSDIPVEKYRKIQ